MCHVTTDRSKIRYESFYLLFLQPLLHPKPSLVYLTPLKRIIHRIDRRQYVSPIDTISNARIGGKAEISGKGKSRIKAKQLDKVKSSCEKKKRKRHREKRKKRSITSSTAGPRSFTVRKLFFHPSQSWPHTVPFIANPVERASVQKFLTRWCRRVEQSSAR